MRTLATVDVYPPSSLNADAISPTGEAWRFTSVTCTVSILHDGDSSPTVSPPFTLNPFFAGKLAHPPGLTQDVNMRRGSDETREVSLIYENRRPSAVAVSAQTYSSTAYLTASPRTTSLSPGQSSDLRIPVVIDDQTPEGSRTLALKIDVTDSLGTVIETGYLDVTWNIIHPVELVVEADPLGSQVVPNQASSVGVRLSERYGWKDVTLNTATSTVSCAAATGWNPRLTFDRTIVSAGSPPAILSRIQFSVPDLDAKEWRHRSIPCLVTIFYSAPGGIATGVPVTIHVDPILPAALSINFPSEAVFLFDRPRQDRPVYHQPLPAIVQNWGEEEFAGTLVVSYSGPTCAMTWRGDGPITLGVQGGEPAKVSISGIVSLAYDHAEGKCAPSPIPAGGANAPLLSSMPTLSPGYGVTHSARLVLTESIDFGQVQVGARVEKSVAIREVLGYQPVVLRLRINPESDAARLASETIPDAPSDVQIPAGSTASAILTFAPPPSSPPCALEWRLEASPTTSRPGLNGTYLTSLSAQTALTGISEEISRLHRLKLRSESDVRQLLSRLEREGCGLTVDEISAAQRVLLGLQALHSLPAEGTMNDARVLMIASTTLSDLQSIIEVGRSSRHPAIEALEAPYMDAKTDATMAVARLANQTNDVKGLTELLLAADELGVEKSRVFALQARRDAEFNLSKERDDHARAALDRLFAVPERAPRGFELAQGFAVNPNPFKWAALKQVRAEVNSDAATARAAFGSHGPLITRVQGAESDAIDALRLAQKELLFGAFVDGAVAVGLTVAAGRVIVRYGRDLEEVGIGREFST